MTSKLRAWLDGKRERIVWIEFDRYAAHVFAADAADWLSSASVYVGGITQAQGVVGTDVLSIDVFEPFLAAIKSGDEVATDIAQSMLQLEAPQQFVAEVIDALGHRFADSVDIVLRLPSPAELLRQLGASAAPTFDECDDIGIALSNLLRAYATKPIAGIQITSTERLSADECEALESVISASRHYGWSVALGIDDPELTAADVADIDLDLLLCQDVEIKTLDGQNDSSPARGGGLGASYWAGEGVMPSPDNRCLLYGAIPAATQPELVIQRVADLSR